MVFYNGFNLLVDILLVATVFLAAHGIGYRKGLGKATSIAKGMANHPAFRDR